MQEGREVGAEGKVVVVAELGAHQANNGLAIGQNRLLVGLVAGTRTRFVGVPCRGLLRCQVEPFNVMDE